MNPRPHYTPLAQQIVAESNLQAADRQRVIAETIKEHHRDPMNPDFCMCGVAIDGTGRFTAHVAAEIADALDAVELPPYRTITVERRSDSPPHDWHSATSYSVTDSPRGAEILIADKYRVTIPPAGARALLAATKNDERTGIVDAQRFVLGA